MRNYSTVKYGLQGGLEKVNNKIGKIKKQKKF